MEETKTMPEEMTQEERRQKIAKEILNQFLNPENNSNTLLWVENHSGQCG